MILDFKDVKFISYNVGIRPDRRNWIQRKRNPKNPFQIKIDDCLESYEKLTKTGVFDFHMYDLATIQNLKIAVSSTMPNNFRVDALNEIL